MSATSIDLSGRADLAHLLAVIEQLDAVTRELRTDYLIVGAAARDLILVFGHGMPVRRATADIDIAVAVSGWAEYDALMSRFPQGPGAPAHRLKIAGMPVDIVPFGGVERADRTIAWPPDEDTVMSAFGMAEALSRAVLVRLADQLVCKVASLPAQMLLKLTSWEERGTAKPRHDSVDIALLLTSYSAPWNLDRLYAAPDLLERFDYDAELAGAAMLGRDVAELVGRTGLDRLIRLMSVSVDGPGMLPYDMPGRGDENRTRLAAFLWGMTA